MSISDFILAGWLLLYIAAPLLLQLLSVALRFWSRGRVDTGYGLDYLSVQWAWVPCEDKIPKWEECTDSEKPLSFWFVWLFWNTLVVGILSSMLMLLVSNCTTEQLSLLGVIIFAILTVIFAPRFIIDLCRGLKFNNKTGNLDKIEALQKQIDELKGVDKNS